MNETLNGKWSYRSFRHEPIVVKNGQVEGNPDLAIPWSPPGGAFSFEKSVIAVRMLARKLLWSGWCLNSR